MKIHLRADSVTKEHTRITVFIDGKNCGDLCLGTEDARVFCNVIADGVSAGNIGNFITSGNWNPPKDNLN